MKHHSYYVYMLANKKNGTLYVGVTNDLIKRIHEHKSHSIPGFTKKYGVDKLVYFEETSDINEAILREKRIKKWNRDWKINLIVKSNAEWKDLYEDIVNGSPLKNCGHDRKHYVIPECS